MALGSVYYHYTCMYMYARMSPENTHKLIGLTHVYRVLTLGVIFNSLQPIRNSQKNQKPYTEL